MAIQAIRIADGKNLQKAVLHIDPPLLETPYAGDVENFRSDFQEILNRGDLRSQYKAKLMSRSSAKPKDQKGITLGSASAYTIEVVYVNDGRFPSKYTWHILFSMKDTASIHAKIQTVLEGGNLQLPAEEILSQEGMVENQPEENHRAFQNPLIAAQALLFLWVLTDDDQPLSGMRLVDIFRFCYQGKTEEKITNFTLAMSRANVIMSDGSQRYRVTAKGFEYIQKYRVALSQTGKIREVEKKLCEHFSKRKDVRSTLQEVERQLRSDQKLNRSDSARLRSEKRTLTNQQKFLNQVGRAILRLHTDFVYNQ